MRGLPWISWAPAFVLACAEGADAPVQPVDAEADHDHDHESFEVPVTPDCRGFRDPDGMVEWCARLSPEEPAWVEPPRRPPGTDTTPKEAQALRCGTFNLVGGMQLGGSATDPLVLYCDYEIGGGMRSVGLSTGHATMRSELGSSDCVPVARGATLAELDDGDAVAAWATAEGVSAVRMAPDGRPLTEPTPLVAMPMPLEVQLMGDTLLARDTDQQMYEAPVDLEALAGLGPARRTADDVRAWAAELLDDEPVVARCDEDGTLRLDGPYPAVLDAWGCELQHRVSLAGTAEHLAVAWSTVQGGTVAWLDRGRVVGTAELGRFPQVAALGDEWFTIDADGEFVRWTAPAQVGRSVTHPLVAAATKPSDLALRVDEDGALLAVRSDEYVAFEDHYYLYNVLEVARSALP